MSTKPKHSEISLLFTCGTNRCLAIQNKAAGRILRVCSVGLFKWLTPCMCFRVAAVLWPGNSGWQICSTATASQWLKARLLTEGTSAFRRCTDRSVRQEHGCEKTHVTSLTASVEQVSADVWMMTERPHNWSGLLNQGIEATTNFLLLPLPQQSDQSAQIQLKKHSNCGQFCSPHTLTHCCTNDC